MNAKAALSSVLLVLVFTAGCHQYSAAPANATSGVIESNNAENNIDGCVQQYDPLRDYFPSKVVFKYSTQLEVAYHGSYKTVTFSPSVDTRERLTYVLVQCGTAAPAGYSQAQTISIPVRRLATANHSILSSLVALGGLDRLIGVANKRSITQPDVRRRAAEGKLLEVGVGQHANIELAMAAQADLYFTFYSAFPQSNLHPKLWEVGVHAAPLADHMEESPLGRLEWLKYVALFLNQEKEADRQFVEAESQYRALATLTRRVSERPVVMAGSASGRDFWEVSGGRNHYAQLIYDAGGRFFRDDSITGSLVFADYERAFAQSGQALFWIGGPNRFANRGMLTAQDRRYALLRPVRLNQVYAMDRGGGTAWTFPFTDQALNRPHEALGDLIRVLHPEIDLSHQEVFIRKVD